MLVTVLNAAKAVYQTKAVLAHQELDLTVLLETITLFEITQQNANR